MSRTLLAPLIRLDAFVQKRFDSVCFFLMRRFGVRKSHIRYVLYGLIISAYGARLAVETSLGLSSPISVLLGGVFILFLLLGQHFDMRADQEAEAKPGVASRADARGYADGFFKGVVVVFGIIEGLDLKYAPFEYVEAGLTDGQHVFPTVCNLVFWISYLAYLYIRKTPMNPPAEKEKEGALSPQPAPAET